MKNNLLVSSYSEKGRRDNNEDFFITTYNKAGQLLVVVCDGIGGDDDSQVASRLLANHFLITFKKKRVRNFARYYNHVLKKATKDITKHTPEGKTMGTTICAVMVTGNIVETANMGDSRIYYYSYQNNNWKQISYDHNLNNDLHKKFQEQRLKRPSMLTEIDKAEKQAYIANKDHLLSLTSCIESHSHPKSKDSYYKTVLNLQPGDLIHVCTDGVYNWIKNDEILHIINKANPFIGCAKSIINKAYDNASNDNMTSVVVKVTDGKN